jgi:endoglucanase
MYVILTMYDQKNLSLTYQNQENAKNLICKLWAQIAAVFEDYDEHVLFECMNEPRIYESESQWVFTKEACDVLNDINAAFVETIRDLGGNNQYRHLLIPTFAASTDLASIQNIKVPNDDKVIVSVHAYVPNGFAESKDWNISSWTEQEAFYQNEINTVMKNLYEEFISRNIPVVITEFGSRDKNNLEERLKWLDYYLSAATNFGIKCFWWDTGVMADGTDNAFGLFDRHTLTWVFPEMVDLMMNIVYK